MLRPGVLLVNEPSPVIVPDAAAQRALRDGVRRFVARRAPAEHVDDFVQDVFLRMQERAGDLRDEARLAGWALRVAQSVVADHHRARRLPSAPLDPEAEPAAEDETGNANEIVAGWLRPMIALLPEDYARAVEAVDLEGLTHAEYAGRAGLSVSGAKSRVQRGRRMLEDVVRTCCDLELDARGNVIDWERRGCRC